VAFWRRSRAPERDQNRLQVVRPTFVVIAGRRSIVRLLVIYTCTHRSQQTTAVISSRQVERCKSSRRQRRRTTGFATCAPWRRSTTTPGRTCFGRIHGVESARIFGGSVCVLNASQTIDMATSKLGTAWQQPAGRDVSDAKSTLDKRVQPMVSKTYGRKGGSLGDRGLMRCQLRT